MFIVTSWAELLAVAGCRMYAGYRCRPLPFTAYVPLAGPYRLLALLELDLVDWSTLIVPRFVAFGPPDEVFTEDHLRTAFGGRFIRVGNTLVLDDPHHH